MGWMRGSHCTVSNLNKRGQPAAVAILTELYHVSVSCEAQHKSNTQMNFCTATNTGAYTTFHFNATHNSVIIGTGYDFRR